MKVVMVHAKVKPEKVAETEAAAKKLLAAIEREQPEGIHYAPTKQPDGTTFVILLALEGEQNPLEKLPEFVEFQAGLKTSLVELPVVEPLEVVGSYRLFG